MRENTCTSTIQDEIPSWERSRCDLARLWSVAPDLVSDEDVYAYRYPRVEEPTYRFNKPTGRGNGSSEHSGEQGVEAALTRAENA